MKFLYLSIFTLLLQGLPTQQAIDSLEKQLDKTEGEEKCTVLNELYKRYVNNNPIKALSYTRQALTLAERINYPKGIASSYNNMGVLYKNQGSLDKALESYIAALEIQQKNHFENALAYTYSNIGTVYSLKGDYERALDYFKRANDQFKSIEDNLQKIGALNNIGNVHEAMGNYDLALEYYLKSLTLYEELEDNSQAFVPFNNIGNIYFRKGDIPSAMAYYQSALDMDKFNNDLNGQANSLHNIGSAYKQSGDLKQALDYFNQALSIAQETDNKRILSVIYQSMAETYFEQEDLFMAYSFLSLYATAKDSLYTEESSQKIASLESAYELDKKESEIQALKVESELQQLQIQNDKIIIYGIVIISVLGIGLTIVIFREYKIISKTRRQLENQKNILVKKNEIIEEKNNNITESIDYALSVQRSLQNLNIDDFKSKNLFTFLKPKDIVSGDFYWYSDKGDIDIIAAADCTGHGVAGAFMTIVAMTALQQIVNRDEITEPALILKQLNSHVYKTLKQSARDISDHGLDIALCKVDRVKKEVVFAGANRPLFYFDNNELKEIKGTKKNIGERTEIRKDFEEHHIAYDRQHIFYLTSDGFVDQFGGVLDKKYMLKRFREFLIKVHDKPLDQQAELFEQELTRWKGENEQTDDILVMGFRP